MLPVGRPARAHKQEEYEIASLGRTQLWSQCILRGIFMCLVLESDKDRFAVFYNGVVTPKSIVILIS